MYRLHGDTFETIHDFFRGVSTASPREIARLIRGVAMYVNGMNEMRYRMYLLKELVRALLELAEEIYHGDMRMYARLPGGGGLYRRDRYLT